MKRKLSFLTFLLFITTNIFSQTATETVEKNGEIFYSSVEKTDASYNIEIDLFEPIGVQYIEVELYNDKEVKVNSKSGKITFKKKKFFLEHDGVKYEISINSFKITLKNVDNSIEYPKVKVKMLDQNYSVVDYSQKTFY